MRQIVQDYLQNPSDSLLAEMTSEEQRFIARQDPPKKKAKKKVKEQVKEQEESQEDAT